MNSLSLINSSRMLMRNDWFYVPYFLLSLFKAWFELDYYLISIMRITKKLSLSKISDKKMSMTTTEKFFPREEKVSGKE